MVIRSVDLISENVSVMDEILTSVKSVIKKSDFINGSEVKQFEERMSKKLQGYNVISVNSGTDALIIALEALGIGYGDEVITVANSFVATAAAVKVVGANPVFADVSYDYNIDANSVERMITPFTKAIIPVHLYGRPAQMDLINRIANKYGLYVIEDCSQALGASINQVPVGCLSDIGSFSLHPLKSLGACGDGGFIVTKNEGISEFARLRRNHGLINRDDCEITGRNSRLDEIQASILNIKLNHIDEWLKKRQYIGKRYIDSINNKYIHVVSPKSGVVSSYNYFVISCEYRDEFRMYMDKEGIETKIHYPKPIHMQQAFKDIRKDNLSMTMKHASEIVSLPIHPFMTDEQIDYLLDVINGFTPNK